MTIKKWFSVGMVILFVLALSGAAVPAAEQESPAKAAARKKAEERMKKQGAAATSAAGGESASVDLNKSSKQHLMTLPGIGEAEADKIIAARPFTSKSQLRQKDILPSATFYEILDKVKVDITVKPYAPPTSVPAKTDGEKKAKKKDEPKKDLFKEFNK